MSKIDELIKTVKENENLEGYFALVFNLPNQEKPEIIINVSESIPDKIKYILANYNPDLTSKHNSEVKIIGYGMFEFFEDIAYFYDSFFEEE